MPKIYDIDPEVYGRSTEIKADRTKGEIDGILARFGIKDVYWHYDPRANDVYVQFMLSEKFDEEQRQIPVKLEPPRIWHKGRTEKEDVINWNASMRNLYWYIYTHLSQAYVNQSSRFIEFMPNILDNKGRKLGELIKNQYQALPEVIPAEEKRIDQ